MKRNFPFMIGFDVKRLWFLAVILLLSQWPAYSQCCDSTSCKCSTYDLNPSGIMIGHPHQKGEWMLSYRYMTMQMRDNLSGTSKVGDDAIFQNYIMAPHSMRMDMHMVMAMYGITNRLTVMGMFNYDVLSMNMTMLPGTMQMQMKGMVMADKNATTMRTTASGISDVRLYLMYTLMDTHNQQLILSAGLNIPTGNIRMASGSGDLLPGQRLPYMMQLGSGTYDLLPGLTYLLNKTHFTWGSQATGAYRTNYNSLGYALGNELTLTTWLAYKILPWLSVSARAEGNVTGKIAGRDAAQFEIMEPDSKTANYGGKRANGYLGFNVYIKKLANSKLSFEYGQPFYRDLNGPQLATHSVLYAGWGVYF